MRRSELAEARYNPRTISAAAKAKLKKLLAKNGLLSPLTWNRRTKTLVSGHQRLTILDTLAPRGDYALDVAVVDLALADEKAANLGFNNDLAAGEWDFAALDEMFKSPDMDLDGTGFDMADVYRMFGHNPLAGGEKGVEAMADMVSKLEEFESAFKRIQENAQTRDRDGYFLVAVFRTPEDMTIFLDALGLEDNRYQDGNLLLEAFNVALEDDDDDDDDAADDDAADDDDDAAEGSEGEGEGEGEGQQEAAPSGH